MEMRLAKVLEQIHEEVYNAENFEVKYKECRLKPKSVLSKLLEESALLDSERQRSIIRRQQENLDKVDTAKLYEFVSEGDGHGIIGPDHFIEMGFLPEWVDLVVHVHESDGTPKGTIFGPDGAAVKELEGVYSLSMLYRLCGLLGVDSAKAGSYMGRGFQARALAEVLFTAPFFKDRIAK